MSGHPRQASFVSVVVPTHGRPEALARCLEALAAQDHPDDRMEVIVVDDAGSPPATAVVGRFADRLPVRLLTQPHRGPARARNRGAAASIGEILAFTDDDCRPEASWLTELTAAARRHPRAMIGGHTRNALTGNRYSGASQLIVDIVYEHYNATPENARFFASNNLAVGRAAFAEVGGFDEGFTVLACEDRELCDRWIHSGRPLVYIPSAIVGHAHAMGMPGFVRQHFTYGRGAVHYHRIRGLRGSGRMRDEVSFHARAGRWLAGSLSGRRGADALSAAALLAVWQAANAAGFAYEWVARTGYRRDPVRPPRSPAPGPPGPGGA
jgi:GT2 family glycosyltransferase